MRIVRIDQIAPGGASLELHPQLTLLRAPGPELRRRLEGTVRALGGAGALGESGVIEVSGVQLALDAETLARLRIEPPVDPILRLGGAAVAATARTSAAQPSAVELPAPVVVVSSDEADLRRQLRVVTASRTELAERMDQARAGLDSFSTAALDVCIGQIDALEARRATLRVDWEHERGAREERVAAARRQLDALRSVGARRSALDEPAARLAEALEQRARVIASATAPDPHALQLAAQLDAAAERSRALAEARDRDAAVAGQLSDALASERAAVDRIERSATGDQVDPAVVRRLETVRDEIFAADERQGVLSAARNKRRVAELRSEEAILLDRLGFDTYSAYVMGIPSVRAELARGAELEAAHERVAAIESRLAEVRSTLDDTSALVDASEQLRRLLEESLQLLGEPAVTWSADELVAGVVDGGDVAVTVRRVGASLRSRTVVDPSELERPDAALRRAVDDLRRLSSEPLADPADGPGEVPAVPPPPGRDDDAVTEAQAWTEWLASSAEWARGSAAHEAALERLVRDLADGPDPDRIGRWAQVEAELDEALDRLAEAQERVRVHDAATAELAALRTEELKLRDQERDLLARIAEADAAVVPPPAPSAPLDPSPTVELPAGDESDPGAVEWAVIARLSRLRSVSFVGAVPVLVDGVPSDAPARRRVLDRLARLSELVQVVVVADDHDVVEWATELAARGLARCI